ncbi:serine hydrolase [Sphingobacterium paludis]|uniref:beta-lactamase n=1 Tax=Sphingobacterium paludis TaxID=1476465 RepID=A0A4R7D8U0_9SPHI|nr:serine hydrolase [Sphingobacterium paludis]TDS17679.1 beta-lactamase class A [Sphingobacterium paludis]
MANYIFGLLLCISMYSTAHAQKTDKKLTNNLKELIAGFDGEIGIYVQHFKANKTVELSADTVFPTASIVKVPLLVGVFDKINAGELLLQANYRYRLERAYGGSGLMQLFKDSAQIDLSTMISLMLTYSDNVASIWCQELAGGGQAINPLMDRLGLKDTKVNSRTAGREKIWEQYGWGQTTPREIVKLMRMIEQEELFTPRLSSKMYRYLKNQFYNERSLSQFPAHIATASKTGSVDAARGEVVFVHAPSGDFAFAVLTKNNKDQRWTRDNAAEELTRKIANLIWNHYEPKHPYTAFDPID